MKRASWFVGAFGLGWVLGWASVLAVGAWYAYREFDQ